MFPILAYIILAIVTMNYIRYKTPDVAETAELKADLIRNYRRYIFTITSIFVVLAVGWSLSAQVAGDDCESWWYQLLNNFINVFKMMSSLVVYWFRY